MSFFPLKPCEKELKVTSHNSLVGKVTVDKPYKWTETLDWRVERLSCETEWNQPHEINAAECFQSVRHYGRYQQQGRANYFIEENCPIAGRVGWIEE